MFVGAGTSDLGLVGCFLGLKIQPFSVQALGLCSGPLPWGALQTAGFEHFRLSDFRMEASSESAKPAKILRLRARSPTACPETYLLTDRSC